MAGDGGTPLENHSTPSGLVIFKTHRVVSSIAAGKRKGANAQKESAPCLVVETEATWSTAVSQTPRTDADPFTIQQTEIFQGV